MHTELARRPWWSDLTRRIVESGARIDRVLTWKRARTYALVLVALYACAYGWVLSQGSPPLNASGEPIGGDFIAFQSAARLVLAGHSADLYNRDALASVQNDLLGGRIANFYDAYRNPPFFALLYLPFAPFDLVTGFALYTLFSLACLGLALWILLHEPTLGYLRPRWRGLLVLAIAFPPVFFGLIDGENATLSLLLYALLYRALAYGDDRATGIWAALGLFKPQLFLVFPLVCIARRAWRALAWYASLALALGAVSLLLVGPAGIAGWLRSLLDQESGNATVNGWRMASLKSFFDALLPEQSPLALVLYLLTSVLLLTALVRVWRSRRTTLALRWTFTVLTAALVDPHLVDYDLTILVTAGVIGLNVMPRVASWLIVALYLLLLLRAQVSIGNAHVQTSTAMLLVLGAILLHTTRSTSRAERANNYPTEDGPSTRQQSSGSGPQIRAAM